VIIQDIEADFVECRLNSVDLPDDIDTVGIIPDHALYSPNMTFDSF
jgi:hypothetical protein